MTPRLPSAWTVAALAGLLGLGLGSGTASLATLSRPMRIGDFSAPMFGGTSGVDSGGPKAVIEESEHDFGSMGSGQSGRHRFSITNAGEAPLKLTKGQSSCGCTIAELGSEEIAPGESGEITVEWRTKGEGGPFRQQVTVHTSDPRRPDISLRIMGSVVPTWRAIPPSVVFPKLGTSQRETATVTLLTYGQPPPSLERIEVADPATADFFSLGVRSLTKEELEADGDPDATAGHLVTIEARPGLPLGPLRQTLRATLSSPSADETSEQKIPGRSVPELSVPERRPAESENREAGEDGGAAAGGEAEADEVVVEIPIEATVTGDLAVAGRAWDSTSGAVLLGSVSSRTGLRTEIFLTAKGPHREAVRPRLKEVVPSSLVVDIGESKPVGTGTVRRVPIGVTIPPGSPACNHLGTKQAPPGRIVIETGHPDTPVMEIPVRISIEP